MKSKKARDYLLGATQVTAMLSPEDPGEIMLTLREAKRAVELAEQESEDLMRQKAVEAFCSSNCPNGCSFGREEGVGCGAKYRFIQKLKNDESKPTDQ